MPTTVKYHPLFGKQLERLERKYRRMTDEVDGLLVQLEQGERPGQRIPRVSYAVYKVRLPNRAARRGKSGGFRVIYYAQIEDIVTLLTIYSKSEEVDISIGEIQQLAREADEAWR
ncbi:MAG: type II toxin-antitoxin system RelE/ParE family toxin [Chloroflexota bacterium]|nr:type II toxin-antitoxin system RelE/ParE family toxin [Chloroflexota bacterium]MDE2952392.1 type II toxin-antitoxin system RelE/ParE family toxin [Chloroflexota bacterium]